MWTISPSGDRRASGGPPQELLTDLKVNQLVAHCPAMDLSSTRCPCSGRHGEHLQDSPGDVHLAPSLNGAVTFWHEVPCSVLADWGEEAWSDC